MGIMPNVLVARSDFPANGNVRGKLSAFCGVPEEGIAVLPNARTVYEVPLTLEEQGMGDFILRRLNLKPHHANHKNWQALIDTIVATPKKTVKSGHCSRCTRSCSRRRCSVRSRRNQSSWLLPRLYAVDHDGHRGAVFPQEMPFGEVDGFPLPRGLPHGLLDQGGARAAAEPVDHQAGERFRGGVPVGDAAVRTDDQDAFGGLLDPGAELPLALHQDPRRDLLVALAPGADEPTREEQGQHRCPCPEMDDPGRADILLGDRLVGAHGDRDAGAAPTWLMR